MNKEQCHLFWVDLEMTGLGENQIILEVASLITNPDLQILETGPELVIHRSENELRVIEEWSKIHHKKTGLLDMVKKSTISIEAAEKLTLKFLQKWTGDNKLPLCGNSIWVDRRFIKNEMPNLEAALHYRMIDVSSIKELSSRWFGEKGLAPEKKKNHRALDDIIESVNDLKWYKDNLFRE